MKNFSLWFSLFLLVFALAGCATMDTITGKRDSRLAAQYIEAAGNLEKEGDLPAALEQYRLALTADSGNEAALAHHERLSARLAQLADERYELGMKYYSQGKYALARNEFLTALKFHPEHLEASKMLVSREPEKAPHHVVHVVRQGESLSMIAKQYYGDHRRYDVIARFNQIEDAALVRPGQLIMIPELDGTALVAGLPAVADPHAPFVEHTLRIGESLSRLAQIYYGDYKQFHIIAKFNQMDDATRVDVGQKIKVPRVAGLPFHEHMTGPGITPGQYAPVHEALELPAPAAEIAPSAEEEQVVAYRDFGIDYFDNGKFQDAIFELNKAIEAAPNDPQTRTYLARAYFESGRQLLDQQDFKAAQEAFESAHHYDSSCEQCPAYIEKSKLGPAMLNRDKGLAHFGKKEYSQAIQQFEQFLGVRPQDGEVRQYLAKAYFQKAVNDHNKGAYMEAKEGFEASLRNDGECAQCTAYIKRSLEQYKEDHYNKGMVHLGKEQLPEAIAQWEMVHRVDPNFKDVDQNLKKARILLNRLEQIKKGAR